MSDADALAAVLNRIRDIVYSDEWGGAFKCASCGEQIYGLGDESWLECIVMNAWDHVCRTEVTQ